MPYEFHFLNVAAVPAEGQTGGIAILCKADILNVTEVALTHQEIHCMVQVLPSNNKWFFSAIYVCNNMSHHLLLWENIKCLTDSYSGPWLMGGDFNEASRASEKFGGVAANRNRITHFSECLNHCRMIDLGFSGSKFTWTNYYRNNRTILERLDRVNANAEWLELFFEATIGHLPQTHSNHCPLLLSLSPPVNIPSKPFRLESMWLSHPQFYSLITDSWSDMNNSLLPSIFKFLQKVSVWNKEIFGNIFAKKKTHSGETEPLDMPLSSFLHDLESSLTREYNSLLRAEHEFWRLKYRIHWLNEGDANTKFFMCPLFIEGVGIRFYLLETLWVTGYPTKRKFRSM